MQQTLTFHVPLMCVVEILAGYFLELEVLKISVLFYLRYNT